MSLDITLTKKSVCPHCKTELDVIEDGFEANITHNLHNMANAAGIGMLWSLKWMEVSGRIAADLIEPLAEAIRSMKANPSTYKKHDSSNGCGTYEQFLPWLEELHAKCVEMPDAKLSISI
jgi:hypothetical protein